MPAMMQPNFGNMMTPFGGGDMGMMLKIAEMAKTQPEALAQMLAQKGAVPPTLPQQQPVKPMQVGPLVTPQAAQQSAQASTLPATGATAPGMMQNIAGLGTALSGLAPPQTPPPEQLSFAPAAPIRPGGQIDPAILARLVAMMQGAQGTAPQNSLGSLIQGGRR